MKPADILVFDRLSLPGGLVQWADESPANHAAIVVNAIHAIEANRVHGNKHAPAVQPVAIDSYVKDRANRTITILRHRGVGPDSKGAAGSIVERARQYDREADQYAYIDVIPVGLLALHRMYGEQLRARLGWAFRHAMDAIVHQVRMCVQDNKKTLMCSEFVYRCYTESDAHLAIAIDDPLLTPIARRDRLSRCRPIGSTFCRSLGRSGRDYRPELAGAVAGHPFEEAHLRPARIRTPGLRDPGLWDRGLRSAGIRSPHGYGEAANGRSSCQMPSLPVTCGVRPA